MCNLQSLLAVGLISLFCTVLFWFVMDRLCHWGETLEERKERIEMIRMYN